MSNSTAPPRRFWLVQREAGIVAEGIVWSSGQVAVHWPGQPLATSQWASLEGLLAVHGSGERATIEWIDRADIWPCERDHTECVEYDNGAIWVH
ncbi:hypothetical protein ACI2LF_15710 [Kribbella sp. NPDC020789]